MAFGLPTASGLATLVRVYGSRINSDRNITMCIVAVTGFEPVPHVCCPYTTRHPLSLLSSSMTLSQSTHLLGIITHFQALSAIIAPSCYAASLYSPSFLCKSIKEQVCFVEEGGIEPPLYDKYVSIFGGHPRLTDCAPSMCRSFPAVIPRASKCSLVI